MGLLALVRSGHPLVFELRVTVRPAHREAPAECFANLHRVNWMVPSAAGPLVSGKPHPVAPRPHPVQALLAGECPRFTPARLWQTLVCRNGRSSAALQLILWLADPSHARPTVASPLSPVLTRRKTT